MAITTVESFLAVLEQSHLLGHEQLARARDSAAGIDDPEQLAQVLVRRELLSDWQASQLLAGRTSLFLGKYVLIRPLGRGGMGTVFLGRHPTMNRQVALKILSKRVRKDPGSLERFLSEARAVAALNHPNIVQAYDVDNHRDRYYIVLEYVQGHDLREIVQAEGPLSCARAADYIHQACQGLAHAHGRNMIHCDVKPSNLLLSAQGTVKIADLGVARLTAGSEDSSGRKEGKVLGTVDYLAPEQAVKGSDFDHRVDIYSLGCTLYYLLTGRPPFAEGTLAQRIVKHQTQEPPKILDLRPDVHKDLVDICRKMMAKDPDDRFQSVEEVGRLLAVEWRRPKPKRSRAASPNLSQAADKAADQSPPSINVDAPSGRVRAAASAAAAVPAKKRRLSGSRRRKLILLGAGGVLAAVGLSAAVMALLRAGGSDPKRNQQTPNATAERPPAKTLRDEQNDWPTPLYVDPRQTQPDDMPSALPSKEQPEKKTDSTIEKPKQVSEQPEKKTPAKQRPEKEKPAKQQPKTEAPAKKVEAKAERPKVEKPGEEEPKKTGQAEKKQPDKEKPQAEKPKQQKPQATEPKEKKPAEADPFRELAKVVDLPPLKDKSVSGSPVGRPVALGKIHAGAKAAWKLTLLGGREALKSGRRFLIERKDSQDGKPTWLVRLEGAGSADPQTPAEVARIWLEKDLLMFRWLDGAAGVPADHLRNCLLEVGVDKKTHPLRLAPSSKAEPLVVDLDRGVTKSTLPIKQLPAPDALRLEITALEGAFPQYTFDPDSTIRPGGQTEIRFDAEHLRELRFRLAFTVKGRAARLEMFSTYQPADKKRPRPLRKADVERLSQMARTARAMQRNLITQLHALKAGDTRRTSVQKQLDALNARLAPIAKLADFFKAVHGVGKVHFRVFIAVGSREIELVTTQPDVFKLPAETSPASRPPAKKPPAKQPTAKEPTTKNKTR